MTKDEIKNRISMALKTPVLQQGFEIICKENAELSERLRKTQEQLTKAKELIKRLMHELVISNRPYNEVELFVKDVEQFLNRGVGE